MEPGGAGIWQPFRRLAPGKVRAGSGNGFTVTADDTSCPPDTPTHTIACPAPDAVQLKCRWTCSPSDEAQTTDAWLLREGG
jgi:hypothetical protein